MIKTRDLQPPVKAINFKAIFKGTLYSFYIALALIITTGLLMYFSNLSENWLSFSTSTIFVIAVFLGGLISAKQAGFKGIYHGVAVGLLFTIFAVIVTSLFIPGGFSGLIFVKKLVYSLVAGALGGIAGVAFN